MNSYLNKLTPLLLPLSLCFMGLILILPREGEIYKSSLSMDLPLSYNLEGWFGEKRTESARERSILVPDTEFSKADYTLEDSYKFRKSENLPLNVSIVLSGQDMNNSIHRPERCLPTQGHYDLSGFDGTLLITNNVKKKVTIPIHYLKSKILIGKDEHKQEIEYLTVYVFIGHKNLTNSHYWRLYYDIKDRIFTGSSQRWSFLEISTPFGEKIGVSEEIATEKINLLMQQILERNLDFETLNL